MPKTPSEQISRDEEIAAMKKAHPYENTELKKFRDMYFKLLDKYTELNKNSDTVYWTQKCEKLEELLKRNTTGDCWCQCGIGHPSMGGNHSKLCIEIQTTLGGA